MKRFAFGICCLLLGVSASAATRLALVSTCGGEAGEDVLALAEAQLTRQPGIVMLERRAVERVLQEQKLLRCGLSEAGQAIVLGKLLSVQVFAVLETFPGNQHPLGIVIFDGPTGVRLDDRVLPDTGVAGAIVEAVGDALQKRARRAGESRTICLVTSRNADLPREWDSFGETCMWLLERRLLGSRDLAVLERQRLELVNRERALGTNDNERLPGALTLAELELSRGVSNDAVRATVFLRDTTSGLATSVTASVTRRDAPSLAQELSGKIVTLLRAAPVRVKSDGRQEVLRFAQETAFHLSQTDWSHAVQTADAVCALDPQNCRSHAMLAQALAGHAVQLIHPGGHLSHGLVPTNATSADVELALALGRRAKHCDAEAVRLCATASIEIINEVNGRLFDARLYMQALARKVRYVVHEKKLMDEHAAERALAEIVPPAGPDPRNALPADSILGRLARNQQALERVGQEPLPASEKLAKLRRLRLELLELLESPEAPRNPHGRLPYYHTLFCAVSGNPEEYTATAESVLQHGDAPVMLLEFGLFLCVNGWEKDLGLCKRWLAIADNIVALVAAKTVPEGNRLRESATYYRYLNLRLHPQLGFQPVRPWTDARVLVDARQQSLVRVLGPILDGRQLYVLGVERKNNEPDRLHLLRGSLDEGRFATVAGIEATGIPWSGVMFSPILVVNTPVIPTVLDERFYYAGVNGVFLFPRAGGAVRHLTEADGLPNRSVQALAVLGGTLFIALGESGYLVAYDLETKQCDVLASSRRRSKQSPFDDGGPFAIPFMVADPPRKRIVFLIDGGGLWEWSVVSRQFRQVANNGFRVWPRLSVTTLPPDRILLAARENRCMFDLSNNKLLEPPRILTGAYPPLLPLNGWVWSACPWGRITSDGQRQEFFAPLRGPDKLGDFFYPYETILPVGTGAQLIVGDQSTFWLLTLPDKPDPKETR